MGIYERHLLPRLVKLTMSSEEMHRQRARTLAGVRGKVLEIGFGNGLNLQHYPPEVQSIAGVDPSPLAAKLARKDIAAAEFPVEIHTASAESLPFENGAFDAVTMTWTLCTIPDPSLALAEMKRVLKPGGHLHFVEHGLSPDVGVARWQGRLNGVQRFIGGGCNLNRKIDQLITQAGLEIDSLENFYIKGPKTHTYLYLGVATPSP